MTDTLQLVGIGDEVVAVRATADEIDNGEYNEARWTARGTVRVLTLEEAREAAAPAPAAPVTLVLHVLYPDRTGRTWNEELPAPVGDVGAWWQNTVRALFDGYGNGEASDNLEYTATVVEGPEGLVNTSREW